MGRLGTVVSTVVVCVGALIALDAAAEPVSSMSAASSVAAVRAAPSASAVDSVLMCSNCATVLSVRSETRVAGKGVGPTVGKSLDSGVLGDQPSGHDISDTTDAPVGATTNGLIVPKSDRRLADSTVWKVTLQRKDGSTTVVDVSDDPVLQPGDLVTLDAGKLGRKR